MKVDLSKFDGLNPHKIVWDFVEAIRNENFTNRSERFDYEKVYPINQCSVPDTETGKFITEIQHEYYNVAVKVSITPVYHKVINIPKQDIIDLVNSYYLPDRSIFRYNTRNLYRLMMFLREVYEYFLDSSSEQVGVLQEKWYSVLNYQFNFNSMNISISYIIYTEILEAIQEVLINIDYLNSSISQIQTILINAFGGIGAYLRKILEEED